MASVVCLDREILGTIVTCLLCKDDREGLNVVSPPVDIDTKEEGAYFSQRRLTHPIGTVDESKDCTRYIWPVVLCLHKVT